MATSTTIPISRAVPIYVDQDKIAEATDGELTIDGGVEQVAVNGGVIHCLGRVTVKASIKVIVPVRGMRARLLNLLVGQKACALELPIDGATIGCDGILGTGSYSWSEDKGRCTGSWEFMGASPDIKTSPFATP